MIKVETSNLNSSDVRSWTAIRSTDLLKAIQTFMHSSNESKIIAAISGKDSYSAIAITNYKFLKWQRSLTKSHFFD